MLWDCHGGIATVGLPRWDCQGGIATAGLPVFDKVGFTMCLLGFQFESNLSNLKCESVKALQNVD